MQGGAGHLEIIRPRPRRLDIVALNETAATDDIRVTLLTLMVLDDAIRVSGNVRLLSRSDVRLANVPALTLTPLDGAPLALLQTHALPNGAMSWVSWTYRRPAEVRTGYEGRIDHIDLAHGDRAVAGETEPGPWVFTFTVANGSGLAGPDHLGTSIGEA